MNIKEEKLIKDFLETKKEYERAYASAMENEKNGFSVTNGECEYFQYLTRKMDRLYAKVSKIIKEKN